MPTRGPHGALLAPGAKAGPWVVERELGRGGMGVVYAVVHEAIGKRAALKVMHDKWTDRRNADRILLEARVVNAVSHPNIVDIFETGTLPDGRAYIVMERLDGEGLLTRAFETKLLPPLVIEILLQVCEALAAAHAAEIVHRDLKPDNVFLVDTGDPEHPRVKLLDWGIAKMMSGEARRTLDGQVIGTPQYLSPEQARGGKVTPMSDVYSLGVMAYELFTEQPPFEADNAVELLAMHLNAAPVSPRELWPDMPAVLERLILAMLAKDPAQRPTIEAVIAGLHAAREALGLRSSMIKLMPPRATTLGGAPAAATPAAAEPAKCDRSFAHAPTAHVRTLSTRPRKLSIAFGAAAIAAIVAMFAVTHVRDSDAETLAGAAHVAPPPQPLALPAPAPTPIRTPAAELAVTAPAPAADTLAAAPPKPAAPAPAATQATKPAARMKPVAPAALAETGTAAANALTQPQPSTAMRRTQHSTGDVRRSSAAVNRTGHRVERDGTLAAY